MKQDKWIKDLQRRMADYQEPSTGDLWPGIEKALDQKTVLHPAPKILMWHRWAAAAAVAIVLAGGSLLWWHAAETPKTNVAQQTLRPATVNEPVQNTAVSNVAVGTRPDKQHDIAAQNAPYRSANLALSTAKMHSFGKVSSSTALPSAMTPVAGKADKAASEETSRKTESGNSKATEAPNRVITGSTGLYAYNNSYDQQPTHLSESKLSVNVYAANAVGGYRSSNGVTMSDMMLTNYYMVNPAERYAAAKPQMLLQSYEVSDHHQPISFGLTAGYALNARWSVSTGLVYTELVSDFTQVLPDYSLMRRQSLHYIGVPVNLQLKMWSNKKLSTYISGGGQIDINVKAQTVKEGINYDMDKDRLQFSIGSALGLQYNVTPFFGAYIEPGVKYYPDNGSATQNFFKYKPVNFNLQIGVRLNVK